MTLISGPGCMCHDTHASVCVMTRQAAAPEPPRCPVSWCSSGHRLDAPFHEHPLGEVAVGDVVLGVSLVQARSSEPEVELWFQRGVVPTFTRLPLGQAEALAGLLSWAVALGRGEQR